MEGILAAGLGPELILLVVLCIAAAALALVGAVRASVQPDRSAAELLGGPLAVAVVAVAVLVALSTGWDPQDGQVLQARAVSHGASAFLVPMVGLPAVAVSILAMARSGWTGPRRWSGAGWVLVPGGAAAVAVALGGWGQPDVVFSLLRAGTLAGAATVLAVGAARDDERGPGLRALTLGALTLVAAGLETSHGGLVTLLTIGQIGGLTPDTWGEGLAAFEAIVATSRVASWVAVIGLVVVSGAALPRAPRGVQGAVVAALVLALALLWLSRPTQGRMEGLAVLCSEGSATSR